MAAEKRDVARPTTETHRARLTCRSRDLDNGDEPLRRGARPVAPAGALIGALMDPVSCVSCASWVYSVNAGETHETIHQESGMRYQIHPLGTRARLCGPGMHTIRTLSAGMRVHPAPASIRSSRFTADS
jgi:hypothetical protein